jgi:hypothetical protein
MTDYMTTVQQLQRPKMLIHAARMGMTDYRRERDLRRLGHMSVSPELALPHLLQAEEQAEDKRRRGDMGYSPLQHIDLLIAVLAELRLLPRAAIN